jgi:hypothetical protein
MKGAFTANGKHNLLFVLAGFRMVQKIHLKPRVAGREQRSAIVKRVTGNDEDEQTSRCQPGGSVVEEGNLLPPGLLIGGRLVAVGRIAVDHRHVAGAGNVLEVAVNGLDALLCGGAGAAGVEFDPVELAHGSGGGDIEQSGTGPGTGIEDGDRLVGWKVE